MKYFSFLLLTLLFNGGLFAQQTISTDDLSQWASTIDLGCHAAPLTPAQVSALHFPGSPIHVCTGIFSPTGDQQMGPGATSCIQPNHETNVFRYSHTFTAKPCLVTYNFSADNAFRIYVNNVSSPTNILSGIPANPPNPGVCGNNYSGNDWTVAFPGTLNIDDFGVGSNTVDFETENGTEAGNGGHPFWLAGNMIFWQFSDLNSDFYASFTPNYLTGEVTINYQTGQQANGALYSIVVERTLSYPNGVVWLPFYSKTSTNKKDLKVNPCPPVPGMLCDNDGSAVRITFTAMAGHCQVSTTQMWTCWHPFGGEADEQIVKTTNSTDNANFSLTSEQIQEIHAQYREKLALDQTLKSSMDSLFAGSAERSKLQVFPNPSNGHIWLNIPEREEGPTPIKIFNQIGEMVFEDRIQGRQELDLSALPNGLYILKTFGENPGDLNTTQFVLQK